MNKDKYVVVWHRDDGSFRLLETHKVYSGGLGTYIPYTPMAKPKLFRSRDAAIACAMEERRFNIGLFNCYEPYSIWIWKENRLYQEVHRLEAEYIYAAGTPKEQP